MEELRELMRLERRLLREWERLKLLESALESCTARISLVPGGSGYADKVATLTAMKIESEAKFDGLVFAKQMCQEEFMKIISEKISDKKIRRVILSRYSGGESIAEIAQVMGLSVKEVQKMHRAGLRKLGIDRIDGGHYNTRYQSEMLQGTSGNVRGGTSNIERSQPSGFKQSSIIPTVVVGGEA